MTQAEAGAIPPSLQPGRLWSLFDVLKLYATSFLALGEHLGSAEMLMAFQQPAPEENPNELPQEPFSINEEDYAALTDEDMASLPPSYDSGSAALHAVVQVAHRLELPISAELISDTLKRGPPSYAEYQLLKRALYTEIKGKALFYCPSERVRYFENDRVLSDPTKLNFPTAYAELREAGSCYAMGRNTACVLHCMRAAEVGVKAMARALGFNPPDLAQQDWHPVLNKCESLIEAMRNTMKRGPEKEAELQFYSQAAAQFRHFKDGWRVQAAHTRPPFNEGEARIILDATTSFYEVLGLRLSEDAQEIGPEQSAP